MAGNVVLKTAKSAKTTISKFLETLVDPINSLTFGPGSKDITSDLKDLEKEKQDNLKKFNSNEQVEIAEEFEDPITGEVTVEITSEKAFSKGDLETTNNAIGSKQQELLKLIRNPIKNPGIVPILGIIRKINNFNLCNPLEDGLKAAFPNGNPISTAINNIQAELSQIQNLFTSFRIIEANGIVTGTSIPQPIKLGQFRVDIKGTSPIPNGTTVFIQQTNNNTIFTNMKGVISNSSSSTTQPRSVTLPTTNTNTDSNSSPTIGDIITNIAFIPDYTFPNQKVDSFQRKDGKFSYQIKALYEKKTKKTYTSQIYVRNNLNLAKQQALGEINIQAADNNKNSLNSNTPSANPNTTSDRSPVPSVNAIRPSTGVISNPATLDTTLLVPTKPTDTTLRPISYTIEIERFDPVDPPSKKTKSGNTILDGEGNPTLETFTKWNITYESTTSTDIRELAESVQGVTDALRDIGFSDVVNTFNQVPSSFLGLGKVKKLINKVNLFVNDKVLPVTEDIAERTSNVSQTLQGGLTSTQVIERSKVLKEFYEAIQPLIEFDLSLENVFSKQIKDINKTIRGVIPYDLLAKLVKTVIKFTTFVTNTVTFILGIFQFLNVLVKTMLVIVKVFQVLIKVIDAASNALPTMFATAGIVNKLGKVINDVGEALDFAESVLKEISTQLDVIIENLSFLRFQLTLLTSELAKMQQTFETCSSLDKKPGLDLNKAIQKSISAATGVPFPPNTVRDKLEAIGYYTNDGQYDNGQEASALSEFGNTIITTADGTIIVLPGTIWGFGPNGEIVFGALVSLSTGVDFNETRGNKIRQKIRDNLKFYTFNKFKGASYADLVQNLEAQSIEAYAKQVEDIRNRDAGDKFGNFQEVYLGYTIRIQEEKPISDTSKGESNLVRRRGVAFSNENSLVAASDLTFSDDLNLIVNETKYRIKRNIQLGIIGVGTVNNQNLPDEDAIKIAETTGANPLAISNIKAEANNRNANSIDGGSGGQTNTDPVAMRTGNSKFEEAGGDPATIVSNQSSPNKTINTGALIQKPFADFISENPSLKKMQDTFKLLQGASTSQLNDIMSSPGVFDLNGEELAEKLKSNIVSSIDPNPEHVEEIQKKTIIWLEGLKETTKVDYEQIVLNMHPKQRMAYPPFEVYYSSIEPEALDKWVRFLLTKDYTQNEILTGIKEEELREEYKIKFDQKGKGGKTLKVVISRRNQRLRDQLSK